MLSYNEENIYRAGNTERGKGMVNSYLSDGAEEVQETVYLLTVGWKVAVVGAELILLQDQRLYEEQEVGANSHQVP